MAVRLVSSPAALLALRSLVTLSIDCFLATDCGSTRTHLRNQPLEILRRERAARRELNCRTASERLKIVRRRRRQWRLRNQDKFRRPSVRRSGMARRRTEGEAKARSPAASRWRPARFHGFHHALLRRRRREQLDVCRRRRRWFQVCCMLARSPAPPCRTRAVPPLSLFLPKWAHSSCSDSKRGKGEETTLRQQQGLQVQFRLPPAAVTVK